MIKSLINILLLLLPLGAGIAGWQYLKQPDRFPLRTIEVHGSLERTTRQEITQAVSRHLNEGFFTLKVAAVQGSLKHLPWVAKAAVRRRWPDRLLVTVKEHTAVARFGDYGVMNAEGQVFYPKELSALALEQALGGLPHLMGPEAESQLLLQRYQDFESLLKPLGLHIQELHLAAHGAWQMVLNSGLVIILGKSTEEKPRLRRFVWAYQKALEAHSRAMAYIDLRYSNGLAVGWKPETVKPVIGDLLH